MKYKYELVQGQFDAVLELLSNNREEAGDKYERLRLGLIRYFDIKGCHDPELLADETINRVAQKAALFDRSRNTKPSAFFYGFAANVLAEYYRSGRKEVDLGDNQFAAAEDLPDEIVDDERMWCLQKCMARLSAMESALVIKYFAEEGSEKLAQRRKMCADLNCSPAALHTRVFRIKSTLKSCIGQCLAGEM